MYICTYVHSYVRTTIVTIQQLTVAMNCTILTKMERGMFFGNTPLCRGNRVSTTNLRSLQVGRNMYSTLAKDFIHSKQVVLKCLVGKSCSEILAQVVHSITL